MNVPRIPGLDRNDFWSVFQKTPGTLIVSEKQVKQDRLSPMDAVMRSAQYAINAMDAAHKQKKREPLEVWRVNRADGGSHFALRDGNTTYQMLQSQGWDKFPVVVTKELDEADYTPVGPHERKPVKGSTMKKTKAEATPTSYLDTIEDEFKEQDPKDEDKGAAEDYVEERRDDYDDLSSRESKAAIMVARRAIHAAAGLLAAVDEFYVVNDATKKAITGTKMGGPRWKWEGHPAAAVAFASEAEAKAAVAALPKAEQRKWKVTGRDEVTAMLSASTTVESFNKPQKLPKDAEFLTTMRDRDVYAFEEWFYFVDPNTSEVVEITLQKHVPFLQKHLKKGFLAKLGLAASVVEAEEKPWKKPAPDGEKKTLTDAWKAKAKKRADTAGRKYPNLVDNMWASEQMSKASASTDTRKSVAAALRAAAAKLTATAKVKAAELQAVKK